MDLIDTDTKGTVVYDQPDIHDHIHTHNFNLIHKIQEKADINPSITLINVKYVDYYSILLW